MCEKTGRNARVLFNDVDDDVDRQSNRARNMCENELSGLCGGRQKTHGMMAQRGTVAALGVARTMGTGAGRGSVTEGGEGVEVGGASVVKGKLRLRGGHSPDGVAELGNDAERPA